MASDAEIDLVVNATRALSTVQRDLDELVRRAESDTDPVRVQAALNQILSLNRVRDDLNQVVRAAQAQADTIHVRADVDTDDADRDTRRLGDSLGELTRVAGRSLGPLGGLARGVATAGAAAGSAAPLLAGLVVAVESILPAAALATSGLLTLKLATGTVQIAMIGVGDAIKAAFDPETTPEELAKAMEKLGPHAQSFVKELSSMRKSLKALQIDVQNRLFANLDKSLERLAKSVLPSVHGALDRTADSLNDMARGAAAAAQDLGDRGVLGTALAHSTGALSKLERVPGQVVTAFGQLAAASGPALEGLAARAGGVADRIAEKLSKAFESGALEKAINVAISNIDQLGRVAGNIFSGIGNILSTVTVNGQGLFGTLEKISQAFEDLTASKEFQDALKALSQTMGVLVSAVLPLLSSAFKALLPVFTILGPPIQELIKHLGVELQPVIQKLGPVLESLATAFVKLIPVLTPIIDLALQLITDILPVLTPLFVFLGEVFERLAPVIALVAENVASQLEPILAELPGILEQILPQFLELADQLLPLLLKILEDIGPQLAEMSVAFADLLVKLTPLLVKFLEFQIFLVNFMLPILESTAEFISTVLNAAFHLISDVLNTVVIPAIESVTLLLNGDFTGAMNKGAEITQHLREVAVQAFTGLKNEALRQLGNLVSGVVSFAQDMQTRFVSQVANMVDRAVSETLQMPGRILSALGHLGSLLFDVGADMISGLVNGITSQIGRVAAAARAVADVVPDTVRGLLGIHSPSTVMIAIGDDTMAGFLKGIGDSLPELRAQVTGIAAIIPQSVAQVTTTTLGPSPFLRQPINVYIGNERLNSAIDFRVDQSRRRNTLIDAHGRRR